MTEGRNETEEERLDRKYNDVLQEMRVMQTGTQLLAGFLLTLPFTSVFWDRLEERQHVLYLVLVMIALLTTALTTTPIAVHRKITGQHIKERLLDTAQRAMRGVLLGIGVLLVLLTFFLFDIVVGLVAAFVAAAAVAVVAVVLLVVVPHRADVTP
ncbi:DUF6328 family protein [Nocardioides sp. SYSU DS0663]|uniref:DUF6328 family protein n=1 Tax=Nocardioides sp. SYSU DS0663 TaxID=3416445 RepID=UPI003F4B0269